MRATLSGPTRWLLPLTLVVVGGAEWLRVPGLLALLTTGIGAVLLLLLLRRTPRPGGAWIIGAVAGLLALIGWTTWQLDAVSNRWPSTREALVTAASGRLADELRSARSLSAAVAERAGAACDGTRDAGFRAVALARPSGHEEIGVVVLQGDGTPWVWGGRIELVPARNGDSIDIATTAHHLVLETRRPCAHDRQVVVQLLVWASETDPVASASLVERFRAHTDVALRLWPGDSAPDSPDVFDYQYDTPTGTRTLFSLQALPPDQGVRWQLLADRGAARVALLLGALLTIAFIAAGPGVPRAAVLVLIGWCFVRAPAAGAGWAGTFWSSATFYRDFLGPFSASAGALLAVGSVGTVLTAALWEWRPRRTWPRLVLAAALAVGAPYLISSLARGITPPADGVPLALWLSWQFALVAAAGASVALAAALSRGPHDVTAVPWSWWLGIGAAIAAAWLGLSVWSPRGGWPDWYPLPWALALVALLWRPAPRWATIVGLGIVAGSAAALTTWGAELEGRLQVARGDVQRLGTEVDPLAIPRILRLGELADSAPPADAADLYGLWSRGPTFTDDYPALLALWGADGRERTELLLDSVDAPPPLLAALVRDLPADVPSRTVALGRIPGAHLALLHRLPSGMVLVAVLGPRTQLIPPATLAHLLEPPPRGAPLYDLALGTPDPAATHDEAPFRWDRAGWVVTGERHLELPDGIRHVHAKIDLGRPARLFVRGALVLVGDVLFLALLWALGRTVVGSPGPRPRWGRLARAFRVRLAVTLTVFFLVPTVGFAVWTFARTREDADRRRDLLLAQTLRTAQPLAAPLTAEGTEPPRLEEVTRGTGAEFGLYLGGRLVAVSHPVISDLGLLPALLPAETYTTLVLGDGLEELADASGAGGRPLRIGYRLVRAGSPGEAAVLAAPRLSDDGGLAREQQDLALVVLLAALLGAAAAIAGAQLAARALARPVSDLRSAALAIGRGEVPPLPASEPPVEFEPVFAGFGRMAADLTAGRQALDEARRRTAAVLATVATGVVAVDLEGRVLLANGRARSWLDAPLAEGSDLAATLSAAWAPVLVAVRRVLAGSVALPIEIEAGERRFGAEVAGLGDEAGGAVVAITDLTDAAHTARVVAWGEMARQIAHEIKNPLTPLRLGLQHLRRVRGERPAEFDRTFDETSGRILAEIDRLDTVARAFSRFALPADEAAPLEALDLVATATEALALYRLGEDGGAVHLESAGTPVVRARRDEFKEVLVNLVENARNAGARTVTVRAEPGRLVVADDGKGIPAGDLSRIFEPRFSTTTSGAGLGLSIVKRLVLGWGATITARSAGGAGAELTIEFERG